MELLVTGNSVLKMSTLKIHTTIKRLQNVESVETQVGY